MKTAAEYAKAVHRLRLASTVLDFAKFEEVEQRNSPTNDVPDPPLYRFAELVLNPTTEHLGGSLAEAGTVALEVGGYLTMNTYDHGRYVRIGVAVAGPLPEARSDG